MLAASSKSSGARLLQPAPLQGGVRRPALGKRCWSNRQREHNCSRDSKQRAACAVSPPHLSYTVRSASLALPSPQAALTTVTAPACCPRRVAHQSACCCTLEVQAAQLAGEGSSAITLPLLPTACGAGWEMGGPVGGEQREGALQAGRG